MMTWIGWLVGAAVAAWVVGAVVYASWLTHEAHKARRDGEQRKTLDKIIQASMPPAAPGLNRKRVS
jgi:hypothetical protein